MTTLGWAGDGRRRTGQYEPPPCTQRMQTSLVSGSVASVRNAPRAARNPSKLEPRKAASVSSVGDVLTKLPTVPDWRLRIDQQGGQSIRARRFPTSHTG